MLRKLDLTRRIGILQKLSYRVEIYPLGGISVQVLVLSSKETKNNLIKDNECIKIVEDGRGL